MTALVLAAPLLAVGHFASLWWRQRRRVRGLWSCAQQTGMSFSREDLFDLPIRYACFALVSGGHSPWAANVTYGRLEGLAVRAFDLRLEAGHGPRRLVRPYAVTVIETDSPLPALILWNNRFAEDAPLGARRQEGLVGDWSLRGDAQAAAGLVPLLAGSQQRLVCLELAGSAMLAAATAPRSPDYGLDPQLLRHLVAAARTLRPPDAGAPSGGAP